MTREMRGSKVALIKHFKEHKSITSMEAFQLFGITRLSARIFELRANGYNIETCMVENITRFGEPCRYAKYIFKGEET